MSTRRCRLLVSIGDRPDARRYHPLLRELLQSELKWRDQQRYIRLHREIWQRWGDLNAAYRHLNLIGDVAAAVAFYADVFGLEKLDEGEGDAFFKLGEHQFLAMFENKGARRDNGSGHFGIMVRDEAQLAEVRDKLVNKYRLKLIPGFRCDFRDPWGNRIQVVDLHDESLVWLLPYREVQNAGVKFADQG